MGRKAHLVLVVFTFASSNSNFQNSKRIFILYLSNLNVDNLKESLKENLWLSFNGGCSLTVERTVVVRKTRVRLSPSALNLFAKGFQNTFKKVTKQPLENCFQNINFEDKITISDDLVHLS